MRSRRILLLAQTLILALAATGLAQAPVVAAGTNVLKKELQTKLDEWHKAGKFPGATLGVVLPDGESFGLAVGYSDRDAKREMKPDDRMPAGSAGKTFAAAMAMQLIKDGRISLDDKIEKYLGGEKWFARLPNARDVTIRQLMNHTSGLVRYEFKKEFTDFLTANPYKVWTPEERLAYLFDEKPPFEAGKGWDYSDTNYIVLGMIIERVTGKKFYDEANKRFVKKFKLANTIPQDGPELKGVVQGYAGPNNPFGGKDKMIENGKFIVNPQLEWTGGGWASTGEDLARWAKIMYEGKAFDASLVPVMLDGVPAKLGPEVKYGLGAIIRPTRAGLTYGHSGFFPGYMTDMMYFPEQKIAVAVQVNTSAPGSLGGKPLGRVLVEVAEVVKATNAAPQATATAADVQAEKRYFDFLIGEWQIEKAETPAGTAMGGDDLYKFTKVLDGNGILSEWKYNRGTKEKPNFANGMYMSSYDILTKRWSFYFISDRSGQFYQGEKENGRWNFYKNFKTETEEFLQRQWWHSPDSSTLVRKIENSKDGGKTWEPIILITFKRNAAATAIKK